MEPLKGHGNGGGKRDLENNYEHKKVFQGMLNLCERTQKF